MEDRWVQRVVHRRASRGEEGQGGQLGSPPSRVDTRGVPSAGGKAWRVPARRHARAARQGISSGCGLWAGGRRRRARGRLHRQVEPRAPRSPEGSGRPASSTCDAVMRTPGGVTCAGGVVRALRPQRGVFEQAACSIANTPCGSRVPAPWSRALDGAPARLYSTWRPTARRRPGRQLVMSYGPQLLTPSADFPGRRAATRRGLLERRRPKPCRVRSTGRRGPKAALQAPPSVSSALVGGRSPRTSSARPV